MTICAAPGVTIDTDPGAQLDRVIAIAREFDAEIDMHLDLAETTDGMQVEYVCRKTEEFGWGGRVAVGHVTQMSLLPPDRFGASRLLVRSALSMNPVLTITSPALVVTR